MAPRGRPRKRTTRMAAAVDAMLPFGFEPQPVLKKMSELLKVYDGEYRFIEENAYTVLIEALIADQQNENQHEQNEKIALGETSMASELIESEQVEQGHEIVPAGYVDIPICSSTDLPVLPPPPPPPEMATALPPPPPPPQPVMTPVVVSPVKAQPRIRTKPCYGYIGSDDDDDDERKFIILPSIRGHQLSPPRTPPAQPESTDESNKRTPKRRTRWDLRPEDM